MTELREFEEFSDGPLVFPIKGKKYVHELSIEAGVELAGGLSGRDKSFAKKEGVDLWKLILGPLWDEMIADGVSLEAATRAGLTALADANYGREYALAVWETGADPKALEKYMVEKNGNRAQRRSSSTGGAKKTPSRASTRATTARKS